MDGSCHGVSPRDHNMWGLIRGGATRYCVEAGRRDTARAGNASIHPRLDSVTDYASSRASGTAANPPPTSITALIARHARERVAEVPDAPGEMLREPGEDPRHRRHHHDEAADQVRPARQHQRVERVERRADLRRKYTPSCGVGGLGNVKDLPDIL